MLKIRFSLLSSCQHLGRQRRGARELSRGCSRVCLSHRGVEPDFEVLELKRSAYLWKMFLGMGKGQEGKKHISYVPTMY